MRVEKTVFISYRRTNMYTARAVYQYLKSQNYDVFLDSESIDSGAFGQIILNQIAAKAHFVVILTPSALERCDEPGDWLRREIELALDLKRNIVPLMFDRFDFRDANPYLTGKLALLQQYNALEVPAAYFDEAMERLKNRFLNISLDVVVHPTPEENRVEVERKIEVADILPAPTEEQLTAEQYFELAFKLSILDTDIEQQIAYYTKAVELNPQFQQAYNNRGVAYCKLGKYELGINDFNTASLLNPSDVYVYNNRGNAYSQQNNHKSAMVDFDRALSLDPTHIDTYLNRANIYLMEENYNAAMREYALAIDVNSRYWAIYLAQGIAYSRQGKITKALLSFETAVKLNPDNLASRRHYAFSLYQKGAYLECIKECDRVLNEASSDTDIREARGEANFAIGKYLNALDDFKITIETDPQLYMAIGGLAITYHALNEIEQAVTLWRELIAQDERYKDADWVGKEFDWRPELIEEARKLIVKL